MHTTSLFLLAILLTFTECYSRPCGKFPMFWRKCVVASLAFLASRASAFSAVQRSLRDAKLSPGLPASQLPSEGDHETESLMLRRVLFERITRDAGALATASLVLSTPSLAGAADSAFDDPLSLIPAALNPFPQFQTVADIPQDYFDNKKSIFAYVERVLDGDTLRARHVPGYGLRRKTPEPLQQRGIAQDTLSIRLYGVDCPEIAKRKIETSQPFAEEAKQFTSDLVYHKMVKITLLRRDQYGRAVAVVQTLGNGWLSWIPGFGPKDLSIQLASFGLAELYTGGGAEYNGNRDELERRIAQAKYRNRGIWSLGDERISAAEQKRMNKQNMALPQPVATRKIEHNAFSRNLPSSSNQRVQGVLETAVTGLEFAG